HAPALRIPHDIGVPRRSSPVSTHDNPSSSSVTGTAPLGNPPRPHITEAEVLADACSEMNAKPCTSATSDPGRTPIAPSTRVGKKPRIWRDLSFDEYLQLALLLQTAALATLVTFNIWKRWWPFYFYLPFCLLAVGLIIARRRHAKTIESLREFEYRSRMAMEARPPDQPRQVVQNSQAQQLEEMDSGVDNA
ncbi:hypothetical protein, partial [Streptomyces sp. NPDC051572]|uniref:hypothetical protein n=1 Tax=Streptomyces sp. NPDC051572 TaxID=3155802 RepID=UPI00344C6A4C